MDRQFAAGFSGHSLLLLLCTYAGVGRWLQVEDGTMERLFGTVKQCCVGGGVGEHKEYRNIVWIQVNSRILGVLPGNTKLKDLRSVVFITRLCSETIPIGFSHSFSLAGSDQVHFFVRNLVSEPSREDVWTKRWQEGNEAWRMFSQTLGVSTVVSWRKDGKYWNYKGDGLLQCKEHIVHMKTHPVCGGTLPGRRQRTWEKTLPFLHLCHHDRSLHHSLLPISHPFIVAQEAGKESLLRPAAVEETSWGSCSSNSLIRAGWRFCNKRRIRDFFPVEKTLLWQDFSWRQRFPRSWQQKGFAHPPRTRSSFVFLVHLHWNARLWYISGPDIVRNIMGFFFQLDLPQITVAIKTKNKKKTQYTVTVICVPSLPETWIS